MGTYSPILTNTGAAAIAAARANGTEINYTQIAVGDANGTSYAPSATQTGLVNEVWRGSVESVYIHENYDNRVVCEARIPIDAGGFDIREAGVFDENGVMIALARYPTTTKPLPGSGSEKDLLVRFIFEVTSAAEVTHIIDPSLIYATKEYVDARIRHVRIATSGNITLSGAQTIDGVSAVVGDRVLVCAQSVGTANGVYVVSADAWTRALDFNTDENILPTALITVSEGTLHKDSLWMLTNDSITIGTTALAFTKVLPDESQRTIIDTEAPTGNTATPTKLWSWLANTIKSITGKPNWRTAPAITLESTKSHVDATVAHGATSASTAMAMMLRDVNGYSNVATPPAGDASTKIATTAFVEPKVDKLQTLTSAINLDTLKTTGFYMNPISTNATSNNYPEISAGYLSVVGNGMSAEQTYAVYNSTKKWRRFCINDGTWTAWAVIWDANSDGAGSGLDADLLDGLNSADFTRRWYVATTSSTARWAKLCSISAGMSGGSRITFLLSGGVGAYGDARGNGHAILDLTLLNTSLWAATLYNTIGLASPAIRGVKIVDLGNTAAEVWLEMSTYATVSAIMLSNNEAKVTPTSYATTTAPEGSDGYIYYMWHSGNDGAGSWLDADMLDGIESARMIYGDSANGSIAVTDANVIVKSGFYHCDSAAANIPVVLGGSLLHQQHATVDTYASQIFIVYSTGVVYRRTNVSGTWSAWQIMYTSGNFPFEATASNIKMDGTQSAGSLATAARGDHVHPSDALKANIASPAFTGTPTAPTASVSENSTRIATTGWVRSAMATIMSALGFAISLGSSGYIKFPSCLGGFLVQWGYIAGVANTEISGTFPLAFPTACLRVIGSAEYANISAVNGNAVSIAFTSASGFHAICSEDATQINYVAIGY
ncbi:MAG: phage tail protein [Deferribacterales bacterium]